MATNPLQDMQWPVTVIHNVESNRLNPVTTIKRSRSRLSSISTSTVNNLSCTTSSVPANMIITSENHSPGQEIKTPPTPSPRWATPAVDPKHNNLLVVFTVAFKVDHSIDLDGFQNTPLNLNTSPRSPQIATSNKSLTTTFSQESGLAPITPGHPPMAKQVLITDSTTPNVPSPNMTSFTLPQSRREREGQKKAQCFQGSDVSETQYKESKTILMSSHETIDDTWSRINSVQEELEDLDEEENVHPEAISDVYLAVDSRCVELIGDSYVPLESSKTIATKDSDNRTRCNITLFESGSSSSNKRTQFGQIIGGELSLSNKSKTPRRVWRIYTKHHQSSLQRHLQGRNIQRHFAGSGVPWHLLGRGVQRYFLDRGSPWHLLDRGVPRYFLGRLSYDTCRTEVIHGSSWVVNFNWKCLENGEDDDDTDYEVDNVLST